LLRLEGFFRFDVFVCFELANVVDHHIACVEHLRKLVIRHAFRTELADCADLVVGIFSGLADGLRWRLGFLRWIRGGVEMLFCTAKRIFASLQDLVFRRDRAVVKFIGDSMGTFRSMP